MTIKKLATTAGATIFALLSVACANNSTGPGSVASTTTFHVVNAETAAPLVGVNVCHGLDCRRTNDAGDADLPLMLNAQALVTFEVSGHPTYGELCTPSGSTIVVALRLR